MKKPLEQATEGGYRQSRWNFPRQGGFGQFWGADSEYGCHTKGCGGL